MSTNKFDATLVSKFAELDPAKLTVFRKDPEYRAIIDEVERLHAENAEKSDKTSFYLNSFITQSPPMLELKGKVRVVAEHEDPVLIIGATGTGKELIANALHGKRSGDFLDVNCAGLPSELIESELFGHVKGAFTDARTEKIGMMQAAENGTIFLDEIGEMPMPVQSKLLRAIQEKKIRKVGATESININCRLVCASHKNLEREADEGSFRRDLYWRISTIELTTTPLSVRPRDISLIVQYLDKEQLIEDVEAFCKGLTDLSGNVRALQRAVRRYYLFKEMPK